MTCLVDGRVPRSAGLSSSSALVCCAAISLMYTNGWSLSKVRFSVQLYLFTCLFVCCVSQWSVSCTPTAGASPRSALVYSCIYLLVCLFIYLFVYLFTCLFVYLLVCLFIYCVSQRSVSCTPTAGASPRSDLVYSCIYLLVCLFTCLFIYLFVCLLVCLFIYFLCFAVIGLMYVNGWEPLQGQTLVYSCIYLLVCLFIVFRCDQSHVHQWLEPLQGQL